MPELYRAEIGFAKDARYCTTVSVDVRASPDRVWDVLVDHASWTAWFEGMSSCKSTSIPAHGIGSTRRVVVNGLRAEEEFIAWEAKKLWGFCVTSTNVPVALRWVELVSIESQSKGSRVTYSTGFDPTIWTRLVIRPLLGRVRNAWERSLKRIDGHLSVASQGG